MTSSTSSYLLLCIGGLEDVAVGHIREHFAQVAEAAATASAAGAISSAAAAASSWSVFELELLTDPLHVRAGHAGLGQILLKTDASYHVVAGVPSLQAVLAFVARNAFVAPDREAGLAAVVATVAGASGGSTADAAAALGRWRRAVATWQRARLWHARSPTGGSGGRCGGDEGGGGSGVGCGDEGSNSSAGDGAGNGAGGGDTAHDGGDFPSGVRSSDPTGAPLRFRASCVRDGALHGFRSLDAAAALGGSLKDAFPHWTVDLSTGSSSSASPSSVREPSSSSHSTLASAASAAAAVVAAAEGSAAGSRRGRLFWRLEAVAIVAEELLTVGVVLDPAQTFRNSHAAPDRISFHAPAAVAATAAPPLPPYRDRVGHCSAQGRRRLKKVARRGLAPAGDAMAGAATVATGANCDSGDSDGGSSISDSGGGGGGDRDMDCAADVGNGDVCRDGESSTPAALVAASTAAPAVKKRGVGLRPSTAALLHRLLRSELCHSGELSSELRRTSSSGDQDGGTLSPAPSPAPAPPLPSPSPATVPATVLATVLETVSVSVSAQPPQPPPLARRPLVVVDPAAGSGGLPLALGLSGNGHSGLGVGGDVDVESVQSFAAAAARQRRRPSGVTYSTCGEQACDDAAKGADTSAAIGGDTGAAKGAAPRGAAPAGVVAECCVWDARRLPLRSGVADGIVSDLPFALRVNPGKNKYVARLLPLLLSEAARILRPRGVAVLLTNHADLVLAGCGASSGASSGGSSSSAGSSGTGGGYAGGRSGKSNSHGGGGGTGGDGGAARVQVVETAAAAALTDAVPGALPVGPLSRSPLAKGQPPKSLIPGVTWSGRDRKWRALVAHPRSAAAPTLAATTVATAAAIGTSGNGGSGSKLGAPAMVFLGVFDSEQEAAAAVEGHRRAQRWSRPDEDPGCFAEASEAAAAGAAAPMVPVAAAASAAAAKVAVLPWPPVPPSLVKYSEPRSGAPPTAPSASLPASPSGPAGLSAPHAAPRPTRAAKRAAQRASEMASAASGAAGAGCFPDPTLPPPRPVGATGPSSVSGGGNSESSGRGRGAAAASGVGPKRAPPPPPPPHGLCLVDHRTVNIGGLRCSVIVLRKAEGWASGR